MFSLCLFCNALQQSAVVTGLGLLYRWLHRAVPWISFYSKVLTCRSTKTTAAHSLGRLWEAHTGWLTPYCNMHPFHPPCPPWLLNSLEIWNSLKIKVDIKVVEKLVGELVGGWVGWKRKGNDWAGTCSLKRATLKKLPIHPTLEQFLLFSTTHFML